MFVISLYCILFLRALYLGSVAEKRGRSVHISDLEELLSGCTQLEVRFNYNKRFLKFEKRKKINVYCFIKDW